MSYNNQLNKSLRTQHVTIAGIAIVVAASTLVSDFTGFIEMGVGFVLVLLIAFVINLLLGISAGRLASAFPKAGTIYNYAKAIIGGRKGIFVGLCLGMTFYLMASFAISGETLAGAFALKSLVGWEINSWFYVLLLFTLALIPNLFSIKTTSWIAGSLLLVMMGIRWVFGLHGLFSLGDTGDWSWAHFSYSNLDLLGEQGLISTGLALAIWSFIGIEFCCSLAEEVEQPSKTLPKGIFYALVIILLTSLVMGSGVAGILPRAEWQALIQSDLGCQGECPQLAIGQVMMGKTGYFLMTIGSVLATLSSLIIMLAAMPRLLYGMVKEEGQEKGLPGWLRKIHPKTGTPLQATLLTFIIYLIPSIFGEKVTDWIFSAAYIWLLIYAAYHLLSGIHLYHKGKSIRALWLPTVGLISILISLYYAFLGSHLDYGMRALLIFLIAAICSAGLLSRTYTSSVALSESNS